MNEPITPAPVNWYDRLSKVVQHSLIVLFAGLSGLMMTFLATKLGVPVLPAPTNSIVNNNSETYVPIPVPMFDPTIFNDVAPKPLAAAGDPAPAAGPAGAPRRLLPALFNGIVRHKAAKQYRAENPQLQMSLDDAEKMVYTVPDSAWMAAAAEQKVSMDGFIFGDGPGFFARIFQWIQDHPEQVQALIKLLISLISVFADGGPGMNQALPWDDTRIVWCTPPPVYCEDRRNVWMAV